MPTKVTKEELEKFRQSLKRHILDLEARNKELRRKQFFTERLAERLREQESKLTDEINHIVKEETPFLQIVNITIKNDPSNEVKLYLN